MHKNLVCAIYNHPEAYPPTLNAITELSRIYDRLYLIYRPNLQDQWQYPENVTLIRSGSPISTGEQAGLSAIKKALIFFSYGFIFFKTCVKYKPRTILVYDPISLFCYHHFRKFLRFKHLIWYHNHDVAEPDSIKKYSIAWWAARSERSTFKFLSIFSLPSVEREKYFDLASFKGKYFYLPNYPSAVFYSQFASIHPPADQTRLIYQGSISRDHGMEQIMDYIHKSTKKINLLVIGNVEAPYKEFLVNLSQELQIEKNFELRKPVNYGQLPQVTMSANIGLAISKPTSIIYSTGGTASNKIYEYAACGLPVLYFDSDHYRHYLDKFSWALATDLSHDNLCKQIEYVQLHYEKLSADAIRDFKTNLNFEKVFKPLGSYLSENI
jgi:glycosyltransferase involved in cell wall biosynthesis